MSKKIYPYVEDEVILREVRRVMDSMENSLNDAEKKLYSNVIDPFSAHFDALAQNIPYEDWIRQEKVRQIQKTFQNSIGYFHQNILGSVAGWNNPGSGGGYDVENKKKKIIAEIKNKYNTMNAGSTKAVYNTLAGFLKGSKKGYVAYLVIILPKTSRRFIKPFVLPKKRYRKDMLKIDGATFYEIVTGDKKALETLFKVIPKAVSIIKNNKDFKTKTEDFLDLYVRAYGK
jgi:hypothetical protein